MRRQIYLWVLAAVFVISGGCGDDSPTDSGGLSINDLKGTYRLVSFSVTYSDGSMLTPNDVSSYSGQMTIGANGTITQNISIAGASVVISGTLSIVNDNTLHISNNSGLSYDLWFQLSGSTLTTTVGMGTAGLNYSETDTWQKVSSKVTASKPLNNKVFTGFIGALMGR